ncbi:MAG: hypothetical protein ACI97A_001907 [Planctomycetota bacterium]|jgi:hypothetical protein
MHDSAKNGAPTQKKATQNWFDESNVVPGRLLIRDAEAAKRLTRTSLAAFLRNEDEAQAVGGTDGWGNFPELDVGL